MGDQSVTRVPRNAWAHCAYNFLQSIYDRSQSSKTQETYKRVLTAFFKAYPDPGRVTRQEIEAFVRTPSTRKDTLGKPPSVSYRNQRLTVLSSFFKYSATFMIPDQDGNDVALLQRPSPTAGVRWGKVELRPRAMKDAELERFFKVIPSTPLGKRDKAIFIFYLTTGKRLNEIPKFYGDIEPCMFADRSGFRFRFVGKGKGGNWEWCELPAICKQAIDAYLIASGRMAVIHSDSPLFTSTVITKGGHKPGERPLDCHTIRDTMKKYLRAAGLPEQYSVHSLRHSNAVARYQVSKDLLEVQRALNHANAATTFRYLASLIGASDNHADELAKRFSKLMEE